MIFNFAEFKLFPCVFVTGKEGTGYEEIADGLASGFAADRNHRTGESNRFRINVQKKNFDSINFGTKISAFPDPTNIFDGLKNGLDGGKRIESSNGIDLIDSRSLTRPPVGILKANWLHKHCNLLPSCIVLVCPANHSPNCAAIVNSTVSVLRQHLNFYDGRICVVLALFVDENTQAPISEENQDVGSEYSGLISQIVGVDARNIVVIRRSNIEGTRDRSGVTSAVVNLEKAVNSAVQIYYEQWMFRIVGNTRRINKNSLSAIGLSIRRNIKLALVYEAVGSIEQALKHYDLAYCSCEELASKSFSGDVNFVHLHDKSEAIGRQDLFWSGELKVVSELVHVRICCLHINSAPQVILDRFDRHMNSFSHLQGSDQLKFHHWEWMMRQHMFLAKLFGEMSATTSKNDLNSYQKARCDPLYQLRQAVRFAVQRRINVQVLGLYCCGNTENTGPAAGISLSTELRGIRIHHALFVGSPPCLTNESSFVDDIVQVTGALQWMECKAQHSTIILQLFEQIRRLIQARHHGMHRKRVLGEIEVYVAEELMLMGKYSDAAALLMNAGEIFHRTKWYSLSRPSLVAMISCASKTFENSQSTLKDTCKNSPADADSLSDRRSLIHNTIRLIGSKDIDESVRENATKRVFTWINCPLSIHQASGSSLVKFAFSLDDLQVPIFQWSVDFSTSHAMVGDALTVLVRVRSRFKLPVAFDSLTVVFNDSRYEVNLYHPATNLDFDPDEEKVFSVPITAMNLVSTRINKPRLDAEHHLYAIKTQMKLIGGPADRRRLISREAETDKTYISGVSLWSSYSSWNQDGLHGRFQENLEQPLQEVSLGTFRPFIKDGLCGSIKDCHRALQIREFEPKLSMSIEYDPCVYIGEQFLIRAIVSANGEDMEQGVLRLKRSGKTNFGAESLFIQNNEGINVRLDEDCQDLVVATEDISMSACESQAFSCLLSIGTLTRQALEQHDSQYSLEVQLDYNLLGKNLRAVQTKTIQLSCRDPFLFKANFEPWVLKRNEDGTKTLVDGSSPIRFNVDIQCNSFDDDHGISIMDIEFVGSSSTTCDNSKGYFGRELSTLPDQVSTSAELEMRGGDTISVGFDVTTDEVGDQVSLGDVAVQWKRFGNKSMAVATSVFAIPPVAIQFSQFDFRVTTSPDSQSKNVGELFFMVLEVFNRTEIPEELHLEYNVADSFLFAGPCTTNLMLPPLDSSKVCYALIPLFTGCLDLPSITLKSTKLMASFQVPSAFESTIFVRE